MMSLHTLGDRVTRDLGAIIEGRQLNVGDVVFHWDAAAPPAGANRNVEASYPTPQPAVETNPGLIHWVSVRTGNAQAFAEIQTGDAIVTFMTDVVISGRRGLYFTLPDGKDYVQANVGKTVMEFWDAIIGGQPMGVTVLLRRKG